MKRLRTKGLQWHAVAFAVCLAVSIGLIVGGFSVPPKGVIDGSVLTGVGELFGFAALAQIRSLVARGKGITQTLFIMAVHCRLNNQWLLLWQKTQARQSSTNV